MNKCYYELTKLLKARMISRYLSVQLYRTLIRPIECMGVKCEHYSYPDKINFLFSREKY